MPRLPTLSLTGWQYTWVGVCVANLAFPLFLGWEVTRHGGRVGMFVAVGFTLLLGGVVVEHWREVRVPITVGGIVTAVSQGFPILQLCAGLLSLGAVHGLGYATGTGLGDRHQLTELGGFVVTGLTAGTMIFAALLCGVFLESLYGMLDSPPAIRNAARQPLTDGAANLAD